MMNPNAEQNTLSRADQEKGRLRTFLLGSLQNFLCNEYDRAHRLKRGGGFRVRHEAAPCDVEMHDVIRRPAERALRLRTVPRLLKPHAIFELSQRHLPDGLIRSNPNRKRPRVNYQENPTILD
jgi:hypothetical protein